MFLEFYFPLTKLFSFFEICDQIFQKLSQSPVKIAMEKELHPDVQTQMGTSEEENVEAGKEVSFHPIF